MPVLLTIWTISPLLTIASGIIVSNASPFSVKSPKCSVRCWKVGRTVASCNSCNNGKLPLLHGAPTVYVYEEGLKKEGGMAVWMAQWNKVLQEQLARSIEDQRKAKTKSSVDKACSKMKLLASIKGNHEVLQDQCETKLCNCQNELNSTMCSL
jgi:hypothetical protein